MLNFIYPDNEDVLQTSFSPVSQPKFIINLINREVSIYNEHNDSNIPITSIALDDADELWTFLLRIAKIFKWKSYESYTLGTPGNDPDKYSSLSYYRVILGQWVSGH